MATPVLRASLRSMVPRSLVCSFVFCHTRMVWQAVLSETSLCVAEDGSTPVLPEAECLPAPDGAPAVLNNTAHAHGPRKYDSGDTGALKLNRPALKNKGTG
jgi:hypothetical protein